MIWSDLKQFALTAHKTDMIMDSKGQLDHMTSYSYTFAHVAGMDMTMMGYTWIKPSKKYGVYGCNVGVVNYKTNGDYTVNTSLTWFWTKPFQITKRKILSPGAFIISSPYTYTTNVGPTYNKNISAMVGTGYTYIITKRFAFALDYKMSVSTTPGTPILHNLLVGSRMAL